MTREGEPEVDDGAARPPTPLADLHHLSLTVSDLSRSVPWYRSVLGLNVLGDDDHAGGHTVLLVTSANVVLLLQEHKAHEGARFSEYRPGLDHVSFRLESIDQLREWSDHLDAMGVTHAPVREESYGSVLIFRDPDRIQFELFADPPS